MRIEDGDGISPMTMMQPDITLTLLIDGKALRTPVKFTFAELAQRMVVDFHCDVDRVRTIFKQVEDYGSCCLMGKDTTEVYLIEKVLAS